VTASSHVEPLPGVPEGTVGKVQMVNGLGPWIRVWVQFKNGVWMGVDQLHQGRTPRRGRAVQAPARGRRRAAAEAASRPQEEPKAEAAVSGDAAGGDAASKVPAHLLERSRQARQRKAAAVPKPRANPNCRHDSADSAQLCRQFAVVSR